MSAYQALVIGRPKFVLWCVFLIVAAFAAGLPNFKLDASADSLTLEHDTDLDYFREVNKRYQSGDFLVITFRPNTNLFGDDAIGVLQSLVNELKAVDGVTSVLSMLDAPLLYSPKVSLSDITTPRTLLTAGVDREMAKHEFLHSPIYREMLLGPDGQTTAVMLNLKVDERYIELVQHRDALRLQRDSSGLTAAQQQDLELISQQFLDYRTALTDRDHKRVESVRNIVASYRHSAELFVGGATMITADMLNFIEHDLQVFGVAVLLFMIAIMAIIFRQTRFVILPLLTCFSAVLIMLGFLSWVDWRLTVISSNFVSLLLIISLAITIHLVVRYREYHAASPDSSQAELVMNTVRFMFRPCLYTTLTTMVAFVSLVVSDIRPVIDFGWMMSIGLGVALLLAFIVIPAGLMLLPKGEPKDKGDNSAAFTLKFAWFIERYPSAVLWLSLLIALLSGYGISRLEVENRFIDYFHSSTEIYQGMEAIDRNLGGTISLDIILDAKLDAYDDSDFSDQSSVSKTNPVSSADAFDDSDPFGSDDPFASNDPFAESDPFAGDDPFSDDTPSVGSENNYWFTVAGLERVQQLHEFLDTLPEVGKVQSLATAFEVANDANGARLNNFELALVKQNLPPEIKDVLITPYLSDELNQTRITLRVKETYPGLQRLELVKRIHRYTIDELGFDEDQVHLSGLLVLYNNMLQSLFKSQIVTLGAVFLGILFMFVVLFRSLKLSLIAMVPNVLAASAVLGGMGLAGVPLDMMTITIAAITVGIGVDDTIHYIHRFKKEFAEQGNYIEAMHRSHASIGRAMFYTSVIIVFGFSILALSDFIPSIYFGLLTGFAMLAAILGALTLLPRLILLLRPLGPEVTSKVEASL